MLRKYLLASTTSSTDRLLKTIVAASNSAVSSLTCPPLNRSRSYVGVGPKESRMPRLRHTVEQIIAKLREAEVALSKGQAVLTSAVRSVSPNKPIISGVTSTAASR